MYVLCLQQDYDIIILIYMKSGQSYIHTEVVWEGVNLELWVQKMHFYGMGMPQPPASLHL